MGEIYGDLFDAWAPLHAALSAKGRTALLSALQASRDAYGREGLPEGAQAISDLATVVAQLTVQSPDFDLHPVDPRRLPN